MPEQLKVEDTGFTETVQAVRNAYANNYGEDGFVQHTVRGDELFRAKGVSDETKVSSMGDHVVVKIDKTDKGTLSRIKQNLGMESASTGRMEPEEVNDVDVEERIDNNDRNNGVSNNDSRRDKALKERQAQYGEGNTVREIYDDGYVEFLPQFTKEEANYHEPFSGGSAAELDCENCAHYIEGGGCHVVQGEIDPEGHCEEYYADVGFFAKGSAPGVNPVVNLVMWGERAKKRLEQGSSAKIVGDIKERIRDYVGEKYVQFAGE